MSIMAGDRKETGGKYALGAIRFRAVRLATSKERETVAQWGQRMGLGQSAVSNFQTGVPVSKEAAKKIFQKTGVPMEFLLLGDERYLTIDMSERIKAAKEAILRAAEPMEEPALPRKGQDVGSH